jgi:UDPglucose 6-dehydrogenase
LSEVAQYWEQVVTMNDYQKRRFAANIVRTMFNTVSDKRIAIWGWAFKKDTNDTRESAAIYVARDLLRERAKLVVYDPQVGESQMRADLERAMAAPSGEVSKEDSALLAANFSAAPTAYEAASEAHAIVVLTEWDEFRCLDFQLVYADMHQPAFIFDGRNVLDPKHLRSLGFETTSIGKSS